MVFQNVKCKMPREVRTQYDELSADNWQIVEDCLTEMYDDYDDFVTLTLAEISGSVRYVQATQSRHEEGIIVQLGIESQDGTRLIEKTSHLKNVRRFFVSSTIPPM